MHELNLLAHVAPPIFVYRNVSDTGTNEYISLSTYILCKWLVLRVLPPVASTYYEVLLLLFLETHIRAWTPTSLINGRRHYCCSRAILIVGSTTVDHLLVACEMDMVRLHTQQSCFARGVTHNILRFNILSAHMLIGSGWQYCSTSGFSVFTVTLIPGTRYSVWMSARVAWSCWHFITWLVVSLCFRPCACKYASIHAAILFSNVVAESDISL